METLIRDQWAALGRVRPRAPDQAGGRRVGLLASGGDRDQPAHLFEQMGTLRDALVAALTLDTFNRHAEKVDMANVAQLVNNLHSLFLADGDRFVATPTFHVYEMYRPHHGAKSVRIEVAGARGDLPGRRPSPQRIFRIAGSASRSGPRDLTVTLVHTHADRAGRGGHPAPRRDGRGGQADGAHPHGAECSQHLRRSPTAVVPRSDSPPSFAGSGAPSAR